MNFIVWALIKLSDWLEDRRARKYEKTQDPELSKYRREGKL